MQNKVGCEYASGASENFFLRSEKAFLEIRTNSMFIADLF